MNLLEQQPQVAPAPGFGQCMVKTRKGRCPRQPRWIITLECVVCRAKGGGRVCTFHLLQAKQWGIPHGVGGDRNNGDCPHAALLTSEVHI